MELEILEKIGLSRNEGIIYMTLLRLGTSKVGDILKISGVNTGRIYDILEKLKIKGLISESNMGGIRQFSASPPSRILKLVEQQKSDIKRNEDMLIKILPSLDGLRKKKVKEAKSITYVGFEGIKTATNEAVDDIRENDEILTMGITEKKDPRITKYWELFEKRKILKGIHTRGIYSERGKHFERVTMLANTEGRVLKGITPVAVSIFGRDKVLILNYDDPASCILIYDENITTSFKTFFEQLWRMAKA